MRGPLALAAEILRCADEAFAEAELPEMVHCHARGQRVVGGSQPLREAKPVARRALGERREDSRGLRADALARLIVHAAIQHKGRARFNLHLLHHHDLGFTVEQLGDLLARGTELGQLLGIGLVRGGKIVGAEGEAFRLVKRIHRLGQELGQGLTVVQLRDLGGGQFSVEHAEVIDEALGKANVAEPLPDDDVVVPTAGDVFVQIVLVNLRLGGFAVDVDRQSAGAGGTVVSDGDMVPLVFRQLGRGANVDSVAGPKVNQRRAEMTVAEEHLVAAAAGIGPRLRAGKDDGALLVMRRVNPKRDRKRLRALEVTDTKIDAVVAGQLQRVAVFAGDDFVLRTAGRPIGVAEQIRQFALLVFVERIMAKLSGQRDLGGAVAEPFGERLFRCLSDFLEFGCLVFGELFRGIDLFLRGIVAHQ